jgi:hypothetical protein
VRHRGVLLANQTEFVSPAYATWQRSGELIVMVILGGLGSLHGAILGAAAYVILEEVLAGYTEHWKMIFGPMLVILVLFVRGGITACWKPRGVAEPLLRLIGLQKSYGAVKVTDGVTLDVQPGELHAIIGPNGAGKTTLIHEISGLVAADAAGSSSMGRISRRTRCMSVRGWPCALVPDHLDPARLTALENVALRCRRVRVRVFGFLATPQLWKR